MSLWRLIWLNLLRNKKRTILTSLSIVAALFLFSSLSGILDTLEDSIKVGSESRLVTRNAISLVFDMPLNYSERIKSLPGVKGVTWSNWFGGQDPVNPRNFYAQFAVDAATYLPMYSRDIEIVAGDAVPPGILLPEGLDPKLAAFMNDRMGCVVGDKLMEKMGWKMGQTVTLNGTIYPGTWSFNIRAVYHPKEKAFGDEMMVFHWKYLYENSNQQANAGIFIFELSDPSRAASVAKEVDKLFENSAHATRTETERAFQAGFVSMWGNLPFVLRVIGFAVVFAILLVAANTMAMAIRERTSEIGVLKTLGFSDATIFSIILVEAAIITVGGGVLGSLGAKALIETSGFNAGGMLPPMSVHWQTVIFGIAIAFVVGAVSGILPARKAYQMKIVDALRRVA